MCVCVDIGHLFLFHTVALVSVRLVRSARRRWRASRAGSNSSSRTTSTELSSSSSVSPVSYHPAVCPLPDLRSVYD